MDINEFVTIEEAAKISGYKKANVAFLCRSGKLEGVVRFGNAWMIPKKSIENYKPGPQGFAAIWPRRRQAQEEKETQELREITNEDFKGVDLSDNDAVEAEKERLCRELRQMTAKSLEILREIDLISKKLLRLQKMKQD